MHTGWQAGLLVGKALVHDTDDLASIPALQLGDPPNASVSLQIKCEY